MQALVIIDIQNDYFPGGKMELVGSNAAAENAALLLAAFRKAQRPIFHVQHITLAPTATFFLPDTPGMQIHPLVCPQEDETVVQKHFPNSFRETPLLDLLHSEHASRKSLELAMVLYRQRVADDLDEAAWRLAAMPIEADPPRVF